MSWNTLGSLQKKENLWNSEPAISVFLRASETLAQRNNSSSVALSLSVTEQSGTQMEQTEEDPAVLGE